MARWMPPAGTVRLPERTRDDGWKNPELWPLVNPNLGRSIDFLAREVMRPRRTGRRRWR
jgi:hypothetical protein